jgi:hypothetical protein
MSLSQQVRSSDFSKRRIERAALLTADNGFTRGHGLLIILRLRCGVILSTAEQMLLLGIQIGLPFKSTWNLVRVGLSEAYSGPTF